MLFTSKNKRHIIYLKKLYRPVRIAIIDITGVDIAQHDFKRVTAGVCPQKWRHHDSHQTSSNRHLTALAFRRRRQPQLPSFLAQTALALSPPR